MKRYGFIRDKFEIKFLILYVMNRVSTPVKFDEISEMTLCDDAIDYFEYTECVAELVQTGHLNKTDGERYMLTTLGKDAAASFEKNIAYSVRMKAAENAKIVNERNRRESMVRGSVEKRENGFFACLSLDDNFGNIMNLELMCASAEEAEKLKVLFKKNAEKIYNSVLTSIFESGAQ